MSVIRAHKIRIFPNKEQEVLLKKSCGVARFAYNWALAKWKEMYENKEKVSEALLRKILNSIKREQFPWMLEVTKCAPQQAIKNLGIAFSKFFRNKAEFPKFKKKNASNSFYISRDRFSIKNKELRLSKVKGSIVTAEDLRFSGKVMSGVVSLDVDRWYISIIVDTCDSSRRSDNRGTVGVDLGVKNLATLSDGITFNNPKFYNRVQGRIKRLSRSYAKKIKGSNNREKARLLLAKVHRKIRLARKTNLQMLSTYLCRNYNTIVLEDLNVRGMVKNHKLAQAISDCGLGMLRRYIENKAISTSTKVVFADRFFPSSKTCSRCGSIKDNLSLKDRIYKCNVCGFEVDRDLNAAINLKKLGTCCSEVTPVETPLGVYEAGIFNTKHLVYNVLDVVY
jgi:putative transposase